MNTSSLSCEPCVQKGCTFCEGNDFFQRPSVCHCGSFDGFYGSCDDYTFGGKPHTKCGNRIGTVKLVVIIVSVTIFLLICMAALWYVCRRCRTTTTPSTGLPTITTTTTTYTQGANIPDPQTQASHLAELEKKNNSLTPEEYIVGDEQITPLPVPSNQQAADDDPVGKMYIPDPQTQASHLAELEKKNYSLTPEEYIIGDEQITPLPVPSNQQAADDDPVGKMPLAEYLETVDRFDRRSAIAVWLQNNKSNLLSPKEFANALSKIPFSYDVAPAAKEIAETMGGNLTCSHVATAMRQQMNDGSDIATTLVPLVQDPQHKELILNEVQYSYEKERISNLFPS